MFRLPVISLAAASLFATAACAAPTIPVKQLAVSYADLNLGNRAGAAILMNRLEQAASTVCGGQPTPTEAGQTQRYQMCRHQALDTAVADIGAPQLLALYRGASATSRIASK